jgi:uncharacterized protein (TIGR01777 family)
MRGRVLITGATGLIGRALAFYLCAGGYEVVGLTRDPARASLPPGVRAVRWDAISPHGWGELADGARAIVNLAGDNLASGRWTAAKKRRIAESRVHACAAVMGAMAAAAHRPEVLVQASGISYYGPHGDEELSEEEPAGTSFLATTCVQWEGATLAAEALGVRRAVVRTGVVLARQGGAWPRLALPFRVFLGGRLGSGQQWFSWIHLADQIHALRFLIEHEEAAGPFNLAAPQPLTNRDFTRLLGNVLHRPSGLVVPAWALHLALGEMADALLEGVRAVPAALLGLGYRFHFSEARAALEDLVA